MGLLKASFWHIHLIGRQVGSVETSLVNFTPLTKKNRDASYVEAATREKVHPSSCIWHREGQEIKLRRGTCNCFPERKSKQDHGWDSTFLPERRMWRGKPGSPVPCLLETDPPPPLQSTAPAYSPHRTFPLPPSIAISKPGEWRLAPICVYTWGGGGPYDDSKSQCQGENSFLLYSLIGESPLM